MESADQPETNDELEVRELLHDLDELHEIDRRRRGEPHDSEAYAQAAQEVDRRSRSLIDRLNGEPKRDERSRGRPIRLEEGSS